VLFVITLIQHVRLNVDLKFAKYRHLSHTWVGKCYREIWTNYRLDITAFYNELSTLVTGQIAPGQTPTLPTRPNHPQVKTSPSQYDMCNLWLGPHHLFLLGLVLFRFRLYISLNLVQDFRVRGGFYRWTVYHRWFCPGVGVGCPTFVNFTLAIYIKAWSRKIGILEQVNSVRLLSRQSV